MSVIEASESTAVGIKPSHLEGVWTSFASFVCAIMIGYTASLLMVGSALVVEYGFPLDDSYIHQTVARNFVQYHVLGFIPGVPSSGSTSALWTLVQTVNYALFRFDPIAFNLFLGWATLCLIGMLLFKLARSDGLPDSYSLALAIAPAFCGNFIWLAMIGMEHLLFVAIVLGCIWFWCERRSGRDVFLTGVCLGLLSLTRPEAIVFGLVFAVIAWRRQYTAKEISLLLCPWAALTGLLLAINLYTSHSLMPTTLKGRMWLYFYSIGPHSVKSIGSFVLSWLIRPQKVLGLWQSPQLLILSILPTTCLCILGAFWLLRLRGSRIRYLFIFAFIHSGIFIVQFPALGHGARYQPLNLLLIFPCLFFGLLFTFKRVMNIGSQKAAVLSLACLFALGIASLLAWQTISINSIGHINATQGRVARWLLENSPKDAKVAAFDIGRISYASKRAVTDLGGLTDSSYLPYMETRRVPAYLAQLHIDYVVLPTGRVANDLGFTAISPVIRFERLTGFCSLYDSWRNGVIYTSNAAQCQDIYRVR